MENERKEIAHAWKYIALQCILRGEQNNQEAYLVRPSVNPLLRIGVFDSATHLQTSRPRSERFSCSLVIPRSKHDHMSATEIVLLVQLCIVGSAMLGCKIGLQVRGTCRERAADDLLHCSRMQINARFKESLGRHLLVRIARRGVE